MTARIAINGFGRIGRSFLRIASERGLEVVAVNDLMTPATLAHLLAFDSTYGRFPGTVEAADQALIVNGTKIAVTAVSDPATLDWAALGVDVVVESTGRFSKREDAAAHLKAGARKAIISAPGKNADLTVVMGINDGEYDPARHDVISNASCTTNCVAPMAKVLHDAFGLEKALMTTIHAYTGDQSLLDGPHKDLHRARSAAVNIIPTSTGAARTTGVVIPELDGRLDGLAVRVPVQDGSLTDLTAVLSRDVTVEEVNAAFQEAASNGSLSRVLRYNTAPLVSTDIIGDPSSCVFDSGLTLADGRLVKVFGWYDNEFGYTSRLADLVEYVSARL
ncbi:MAG TPA: type I glyceraldehyde-3-phosphate dehydrogenase [Frankiaceae bacterium]|jgi:glyceraldehyde 3-phosphate dehydrogenase|nr:type I glyceraldehyde-3-phosphate dehydrogenase [Frankiaceae bacterium]